MMRPRCALLLVDAGLPTCRCVPASRRPQDYAPSRRRSTFGVSWGRCRSGASTSSASRSRRPRSGVGVVTTQLCRPLACQPRTEVVSPSGPAAIAAPIMRHFTRAERTQWLAVRLRTQHPIHYANQPAARRPSGHLPSSQPGTACIDLSMSRRTLRLRVGRFLWGRRSAALRHPSRVESEAPPVRVPPRRAACATPRLRRLGF
jgi:hypothetical protein